MNISEKTLRLPAREGARVVALKLLDDADKAAHRLSRHSTPKALHDFRVALRRLRSWLRALRQELRPAVRQQEHHSLRAIARATGADRDVDVQLAWARETARKWKGERRRDALRFVRYLARDQSVDAVDAAILSRFEAVSADLRARLGARQAPRTAGVRRSLAQAMAAQIGPHLKDVADALKGVRSVADEEEAHEARIAAKHLRYLLEPAAPFVKRGGHTLRQLRALQAELGVLHDAHVIMHAVDRASKVRDLGAIPRRARREMDAAFENVRRHWLKRPMRAFGRDVKAVAKRLRALGRDRPGS